MRNMTTALALGFALAALGGCGNHNAKTIPLTVSSEIPAAGGQVVVSDREGPEQKLTVKVHDLARPSRTTPEASVYVVWLKPEGSDHPINLGPLTLNDNLTGTLETHTPYKNFEVFVTPEPNAAVTAPSTDQLLHAQVQVGQRAIR